MIKKTRDLLTESLKISRMIGLKRLEGVILGNLGSIHHEQGNIDKAQHHFQEALAIHNQVDNRIFKGHTLCQMATVLRQTRGSPRKITQLLTESEELLRQSGHTFANVYFLSECGHHALSRHYSAQHYLTKARLEIESMKVKPESHLQLIIDRLGRAQAAFESGQAEQLHQGELISDIPSGLRNYLINSGLISSEKTAFDAQDQDPSDP